MTNGLQMSKFKDSFGDTCWTFTSVDLCKPAPVCVFPLANSVVAACGPTVLKYQFKTSQGLSRPLPHREKHSPENRPWHNRGSQNHEATVTWELHVHSLSEPNIHIQNLHDFFVGKAASGCNFWQFIQNWKHRNTQTEGIKKCGVIQKQKCVREGGR